MSEPASASEVQRFLLEYIVTYDELDVLLHLLRRRDQQLQPSDVARDLGIAEAICKVALEELSFRGLAARSSDGKAFRFCPAAGALANGVLALADAYHLSPVSVITAMSENALQRVRASAARAFADRPRARKPPR